MEGLASRRRALSSGYRYAGVGGEPSVPEAYWTYGPDYMVEPDSGDGLATSRGEPLGF